MTNNNWREELKKYVSNSHVEMGENEFFQLIEQVEQRAREEEREIARRWLTNQSDRFYYEQELQALNPKRITMTNQELEAKVKLAAEMAFSIAGVPKDEAKVQVAAIVYAITAE